MAFGVEGLFGDFDVGGFGRIEQSKEAGLAGVGDGIDCACAGYISGCCAKVSNRGHLRLEDDRVDDAEGLDVEELGEAPAGVVVGVLLRVVGCPVLLVEESVGGAGVGLVETDDVAPGGEGFFFRLVVPVSASGLSSDLSSVLFEGLSDGGLRDGDGHADGLAELADLYVLKLKNAQKLKLAVKLFGRGGEDVGGWGLRWWA